MASLLMILKHDLIISLMVYFSVMPKPVTLAESEVLNSTSIRLKWKRDHGLTSLIELTYYINYTSAWGHSQVG